MHHRNGRTPRWYTIFIAIMFLLTAALVLYFGPLVGGR